MIRAAVCASLLALLLAATDFWRPPLVTEAERARFADACGAVAARPEAAVAPGPGSAAAEADGPAFPAVLAGACRGALVELDAGPRSHRIAAARLLLRLTRLQETVSEMNADRAARGAAPVTATGEYLIAHRIGVVSALDVWLDSAPGFSLASHP
jgi:hypothetical protein